MAIPNTKTVMICAPENGGAIARSAWIMGITGSTPSMARAVNAVSAT
jgi:hypothetical protein